MTTDPQEHTPDSADQLIRLLDELFAEEAEADVDADAAMATDPAAAALTTGAVGSLSRGRRHPAVVPGLALLGAAALAVLGLGVATLSGTSAAATAAQTDTATDEHATTAAQAAQAQEARAAQEPESGDTAAHRATTGRGTATGPAANRVMRAADPAWVADVAQRTAIPERALSAYAGAALTLASEQPGCGLGWNTLAAIAAVETEHGTINGSRLTAAGYALPRILGVPLDGVEFLATPDTDGGRLDGDPLWDRAVGPMQFIPQTWEQYGRSATLGAQPDIDQIDDAALSAATLLCALGGDLRDPEHWINAVNAYNPSVAYNNRVAEAAEYYGAAG